MRGLKREREALQPSRVARFGDVERRLGAEKWSVSTCRHIVDFFHNVAMFGYFSVAIRRCFVSPFGLKTYHLLRSKC